MLLEKCDTIIVQLSKTRCSRIATANETRSQSLYYNANAQRQLDPECSEAYVTYLSSSLLDTKDTKPVFPL